MKVDEILKIYTENGHEIFQKIELNDSTIQEYLKPSIDNVIEMLPWQS
ncbi:hypothetical protein [Nostoc parmelioides]|uniref:Uncharacterized protein n=1 Tax=Nostoc parmelioides FACHB-3921 TaxID=2692909 RepID=A0ABR8BKD5_9NOSO|nr:hypothetical protein [Nostoc parmelioides]MBD2253358.1 hypothetical protein [Nostoc parmelioides FACHB-3921]